MIGDEKGNKKLVWIPDQSKEVPNPRFHHSPVMQVRFPNGEVVAINRKERRRLGIKIIK